LLNSSCAVIGSYCHCSITYDCFTYHQDCFFQNAGDAPSSAKEENAVHVVKEGSNKAQESDVM